MNKPNPFRKFYFKDTSFASLMKKRVFNILLIASRYDAFVLEDNGRVEEQIFNEYVSLNLRYPPRFTRVADEQEATEALRKNTYELIMLMPADLKHIKLDAVNSLKALYPEIPIVILAPFSKEVSKNLADTDLSAIDYVFSWLGNTDLLLAIIKLIEDKLNAPDDTGSVGVRVILVVEDSVRYYSSMLPNLYKFILEQSKNFSTEALNAHQQMLRMRGRPKIILARTYEEAHQLYQQYRHHIQGLICDMSFNRNGQKDKTAGLSLCRHIRLHDQILPIILTSSDENNQQYAETVKARFINKNPKTFPFELRQQVTDLFGFGDFVFKDSTGVELARIHNLKELQEHLFTLPDTSLREHLKLNHVSRWLYSRAMFPLAAFLESFTLDDQTDMKAVRQVIYNAIDNYRKTKNRGIVADFSKERFDQYATFTRIGTGSMGGKGRGLAFLDGLIKRHNDLNLIDNLTVSIPRTLVICTDVFDQFMENNQLYPLALSETSDGEILHQFLGAHLPDGFNDNLLAFLSVIRSPIAIRSSSLLEDSHYQPFAGIYSTYMIPYVDPDTTLLLLKKAIKAVYASVFYKSSKAYLIATSNIIDQEKMGIILEEVCGSSHGNRFYPTFSGVARSLNYYPVGHEKPEEGVVNVAYGLGKYVMDGGTSLRFSPAHPHHIIQLSTVDTALKQTQTHFLSLDLEKTTFEFSTNEAQNLHKNTLQEVSNDNRFSQLISTYDQENNLLRDGDWGNGRKVVTFSNILQNNSFPLPTIINQLLNLCQQEMGRPVEIEFAVELNPDKDGQQLFSVLQIRPIVDSRDILDENLEEIPTKTLILKSHNALGFGIERDVTDIIYVRQPPFGTGQPKSQQIAREIESLNNLVTAANRNYILIGPGRWGSSDPAMGIPVKWSQIAAAKLIVEAGATPFPIEPSQGTHFFQNLTSFGVAYYTVSHHEKDFCDFDYLNRQPALFENSYVRHIRFEQPVIVKTDALSGIGVIQKPGLPT